MAFDVLDQQYRHDEIRARMQSDKDMINRLKNQLDSSVALHTEISANPEMIPWYQGLSAEEKAKLQGWCDDAAAILAELVARGF